MCLDRVLDLIFYFSSYTFCLRLSSILLLKFQYARLLQIVLISTKIDDSLASQPTFFLGSGAKRGGVPGKIWSGPTRQLFMTAWYINLMMSIHYQIAITYTLKNMHDQSRAAIDLKWEVSCFCSPDQTIIITCQVRLLLSTLYVFSGTKVFLRRWGLR